MDEGRDTEQWNAYIAANLRILGKNRLYLYFTLTFVLWRTTRAADFSRERIELDLARG